MRAKKSKAHSSAMHEGAAMHEGSAMHEGGCGDSNPGEDRASEPSYEMPGSATEAARADVVQMPRVRERAEGRMPEGRMNRDPGGDEGDMPGGGGMGGGGGSSGDSGGGGGDRTPQVRRCATMDVHRRLLSTMPEYARARAAFENVALASERGERLAERPGVTRIPVVVHVVWNTPEQNISDAQIASQIDVLNRDFRRTNPDINNTPAPFLPLATDARIEFFLATTGPNGAPTTGIQRRQTTVGAFSANDAVKSNVSGLDAWPARDYLNIWVCQLSGGLLGYAQFPGGPAATDGIVVLHSAFGTVGTAAAPFNLGRTATHEIGHWLNLNHIWGDDGSGCSGTDNVGDTPNQGGANTGTPTFPRVSCSNGPNGDMFMNYMDYVDDAAMFMFSAGQVARMQACLDVARAEIGVSGGGAVRASSSPVVAWGANRLDAFVLGSDRALYHKWWSGSAWGPSVTGYEAMGGVCTCVPQTVAWGPNRLDVFVTGTDSALYHKWWNGAAWGPSLTGYEYMGGVCVGDPRIVSWGPNRLDVFVIGSDRAVPQVVERLGLGSVADRL
jgi:Pregnancy-associated plasma protein-A/Repeat of unknown function (DUF346)